MNDKTDENRCEAEVAGTRTDGNATMENCPSHCPTNFGDKEESNYTTSNQLGEPFTFTIDEDVRWHPESVNNETHLHRDFRGQNSENIFPDVTITSTTTSATNPFNSNPTSDVVTIMIDNDNENDTNIFQMQTQDDIAQVLENFNSILDSIDLNYSSSIEPESCSSHDLGLEFSDGGGHINDEEEFLIVVNDRNDNNDNSSEAMDRESCEETESPIPDSEDNNGSEPDPEEGYESDRPMVRASMRKLKPVQMLPMPISTSTSTIIESPIHHQTIPGFATTLNSPLTNRILVASLVNTVLSPGYNEGGTNENSNPGQTIGIGTTTGSRSQCHSRSQSHNNNHAFISNGNASDLTTSASVIDLVHDVPSITDSNSQPATTTLGQLQNKLNLVPVPVQGSSNSSSSGSSANFGMSSVTNSPVTHNYIPDPNTFGLDSADPVTILAPIHPSVDEILRRAVEAQNASFATTDNELLVETVQIGAAVISQSQSQSNSSSASTSTSTSTVNTDTSRRSSTTNPTVTATATTTTGTRRNGGNGRQHISAAGVNPGRWPHRLSSVLALIGCTLGLNNICRFGLLSVEYGANFTIQFIFLSLVFGIPLLTFHMSSGQYLASGIIDMWKISPIFQGIGIGLVIAQAMVGVYTAVGVSWMFIYFRDSFITRFDLYRWGKCFRDFRDCDQYLFNSTQLAETVPDYFNGVVLQRSSPDYPNSSFPTSSLKFTVAFNLAVVWMLIFVSLSKGLKSYGKAIHGFVLVPVFAILVLASKMVGLVPSDQTSSLFGQTAWSNFFFNSQTWVIAAREAFFTWGLLGACVMQVTSHNRPSHSLKSDASIVIFITTFVLLLSAFLGNACYSVLASHGYTYVASSFESDQTYKFLIRKPPENLLPSSMSHHTSFLMGVRIVPPSDMPNGSTVSGYQVLRLATELFPATMAVLGSQGLSPFWTVLFYFTFVLFGIAQQLAIWYCVIKGVIAIKAKALKSWETTITFFVCALGFLLGLPLCTEFGIFVEYFLDYAIGSGWWIMVLYLLELVAVFIVRGAPYCGENIVTVLMTGTGKLTILMAPLISFLWNVILPVAMLVLSITSFKSGNIRELYDWNPMHGYGFFPIWSRELGTLIQLVPILTVPFVAIVQSCRYLTNGPPDLFDRMQQLYRPHSRGLLGRTLSAQLRRDSGTDPSGRNDTLNRGPEDPPPKYTPPPSYSTATSARIAKFLRNSLRRSLRRLPGGSRTTSENLPPPPNYASVILEINSQSQQSACSSTATSSTPRHPIIPILISPPVVSESREIGNHTSPEEMNNPAFKINLAQCQTLGRHLEPSSSDKARGSLRRIASDITPREVARILRASFRQNGSYDSNEERNDGNLEGNKNGTGQEYSEDSDHLQLQPSSSGFPKNYNFDFSRKRRSNDSQLALISTQSRNNSDNDLPYYADLMNLGIINPPPPTIFQSTNLFPPPSGPGHLRSHSLNVNIPTSSHSVA